ncbi:MAG: NAD(P)-dependent oxidoreductase [Desulfobacterales bacterium]|nr:NAD(P)-dependent oxidoreductase [Desulfobacterales bacterium]
MKKIVVTGNNGFIGSLLTNMLIKKHYEVIGIDTGYFSEDCVLYPNRLSIKEIKKDLRDISEKDINGSYAICHLGALSNDPMGEIDPELTFEINYRASVRLAKLAKKTGVKKFIYSSSCSLYGIANSESDVTEEGQLNPLTAYAKSKVQTEKEILPMTDERFFVTCLRNSTAYGVSPKLRVDLVANNLVGWALTSGEIRIMSDGSPWRPLIHAEDIARAFIAVIEAPDNKVSGQAFNVGVNSENYRVREIAELVAQAVPGCRLVFTGEHGADSRSYRVNFDKIRNNLPEFQPQWTLKQGIAQLVEYYRKYEMTPEKFSGRYFIRLKQLQYLLQTKQLDPQLIWNTQD